MNKNIPKAVALAMLLVLGAGAQAHTSRPHGNAAAAADTVAVKEQKPWGIAGDTRDIRRVIDIDMRDDMRFRPALIEVRQGETVRLRVKNSGKVLHELVIGTRRELQEHAAMMKKFPGMEHDEPYMAHVDPGKRGELVWHFNRAGEFEFACLIPGHFEAGMVGRIRVVPAGGN